MCQGKKRILIIENVSTFRASLKRSLEADGYEVLEAATADEGRERLAQEWVHLALVDVRARTPEVDESDDESGLDLIRDKAHPSYGVIPRLILTAYPEWDKVKRALAPDENGITPAEDFLVKGVDSPEEILRKVEETIERWWSPRLDIDWEASTPICLASFLEPEEKWQDGEHLEVSARELGALLCRAYANEPQIRKLSIRRVRRGHARTFIAFARTHLDDAIAGREDVLKCGPREVIEQEIENYREYVRPHTHQIHVQRVSQTTKYATIRYNPAGGRLGACETFKDFYRDSQVEEIKALLTRLFRGEGTPLRTWYHERRVQKETHEGRDIFAHYNQTLKVARRERKRQINGRGPIERLLTSLEKGGQLGIRVERHRNTLTVHVTNFGAFAVSDFMALVRGEKTLPLPAPHWWGVTHGDLNGENILVDEQGTPWLIDFERTGWGPAFRDAAELESVIRWELLRTNNMRDIVIFEEVLLKAALQSGEQTESLVDNNGGEWSDDLKKAARVILHLRDLLGAMYGRGPRMYQEYLVGMFFYALRFVSKDGITSPGQVRSPIVRKTHALLSALRIAHIAQNGWQELQNE